MTTVADDLRAIYDEALARVSPSRLVSEALETDRTAHRFQPPVRVVAIGKCAVGMLAGAAAYLPIVRAFVAIPEGYDRENLPVWACAVTGTHPEMSDASFDAGRDLLRFIHSGSEPVIALVSGGSSASVEAPLAPWFSRGDLADLNHRLLRSGLPISKMNVARRHVSAIKGGRLARLIGSGALTVVLSDVERGRPGDVGSGPTFADPSSNADAAAIIESLGSERCIAIASTLRTAHVFETEKNQTVRHILAGDNATLVRAAVESAGRRGWKVVEDESEISGSVDEAAERFAIAAASLPPGTMLIAGGEPTVEVRGAGRGGRASELAVRFARGLDTSLSSGTAALFASSDGIDGSSEAAGWIVQPGRERPNDDAIADALDSSDSATIAESLAERIPARPTGNNLRDIFMVARISANGRSNG